MREFFIDGNNFNNIEEFYCEIDSLFTRNLNWETGHNLDAFDDILRGGFGVHDYGEPIKIIWGNFAKSKRDFGYETTVRHYEEILTTCHPTNISHVQKLLADAKSCKGKTLMDDIVDIILADDSGHNCILEIIE